MISYKTVCYVRDTPVPVEMTFEGENPFEIVFTFYVDGGATVWHFDKGLLDGLVQDGVSGEGDVQFLNVDHCVSMRLTSHEGTAIIEMDPCAIEEFLAEVDASPELEFAGVSISDDEIYGWLGDEAA